MYYSTVSLQVSVPFVAKSILHRKIKCSRGFSVSLQVGIASAAKSFSQSRITISFRASWAPAGSTGVTSRIVPLVLWRTTL